jgi:hypothetical protein
MGSDHDVYQDSSFGIPAIYLNDWPDRYIHTNFDTAANIDPTKLKRVAFIGAASGYYLASLTAKSEPQMVLNSEMRAVRLSTQMTGHILQVEPAEQQTLNAIFTNYISGADKSLQVFLGAPRAVPPQAKRPSNQQSISELIFKRRASPGGPLVVFGFDYFADHAKTAGVATPKLLGYEGLWGTGEEYAYEVLNFADGTWNAQEIRDAVSAEYGPVPLEMVVEYLKALEKIAVVEQVKQDH